MQRGGHLLQRLVGAVDDEVGEAHADEDADGVGDGERDGDAPDAGDEFAAAGFAVAGVLAEDGERLIGEFGQRGDYVDGEEFFRLFAVGLDQGQILRAEAEVAFVDLAQLLVFRAFGGRADDGGLDFAGRAEFGGVFQGGLFDLVAFAFADRVQQAIQPDHVDHRQVVHRAGLDDPRAGSFR